MTTIKYREAVGSFMYLMLGAPTSRNLSAKSPDTW